MLSIVYFVGFVDCLSAIISLRLHHYPLAVVLFSICGLLVIFSIDLKRVRKADNRKYSDK
ncbi:MAG: hypothetical protein ACI4WG_06765 [Erysipelotrichaceae bacterium]